MTGSKRRDRARERERRGVVVVGLIEEDGNDAHIVKLAVLRRKWTIEKKRSPVSCCHESAMRESLDVSFPL